MAKYKVEYIRESCIAGAVCAAYAPEEWELSDDDGLADLIDGKKEGDKWVKVIEEKALEENKLAAECCPARVIKITNMETGEVIVDFDNTFHKS